MTISAITAQQRLDSRGKPTIQVLLQTAHGTFRAIVPSGASKGSYEAVEIRDGDPHAFQGQGVIQAVRNVKHVLAPAIVRSSLDPARDLSKIDELMINLDGTPDKSNLGANAILAVSMKAARQRTTLSSRGNPMAFQEFMIAPILASSFAQAVQWNAETYACLRSLLIKKYGISAVGLGDEGGFAPPLVHPREALALLMEAIHEAGHQGKIKIGIDPASQSFARDGKYDLAFKTDKAELLSPEQLGDLYKQLLAEYPVVLLEDPFGQDDWKSFPKLHADTEVELVGDDLLATNRKRIEIGVEKRACNSLLLKINQIGTISEALQAANQAFDAGWSVFVSHRSGETTDDFIADLAVGLRTGHLKSGAPARGERLAKYNRLMDIEDELETRKVPHRYAGSKYQMMRK